MALIRHLDNSHTVKAGSLPVSILSNLAPSPKRAASRGQEQAALPNSLAAVPIRANTQASSIQASKTPAKPKVPTRANIRPVATRPPDSHSRVSHIRVTANNQLRPTSADSSRPSSPIRVPTR